MSSNVVPTLSTDGWVETPIIKADRLFAHFFVSEYSQTFLYKGNVTSFPYIIQNNKEDPSGTASAVKISLTNYFNRYYENCDVAVDWKMAPEDTARVELEIYVELLDSDGVKFSLGNTVTLIDSKVEKVVKLNN